MFARPFAALRRLPPRRALATAFGLGLLSALALPPVHAVPVLLLAFPGLLALAGGARELAKGAALIGFAWGWGHHLAGIYWVTARHPHRCETWWWLVPIAAPALAVPLALFAVPPVLAARALPAGWPRVLGFAGAWVLRGDGARRAVHRLPLEPDRQRLGLRRPADPGRGAGGRPRPFAGDGAAGLPASARAPPPARHRRRWRSPPSPPSAPGAWPSRRPPPHRRRFASCWCRATSPSR